MSKEITFNENLRKRLFTGTKTAVDAVASTLGPAGRTVLIDGGYGSPTITKDGVTVAKSVEMDDEVANMGATLIKEISSTTDEQAGDGTTTASVISLAILEEGLKAIDAGTNPIKLRNGINQAVEDIVEELKKNTKEVETEEQISQVASISANNDIELGKLIAEAINQVGSVGVVTTAESNTGETYMEFVEGMSFDNGYLSPYFSTDHDNLTVEYENARVLLTDKSITNIKSILPILETVSQEGKPLLIISDNVEGEALSTLILNSLRGIIKVCAVKAPGFGDRKKDMLQDIAILTGGTLITEDVGLSLETASMKDLGTVDSIKVTKDRTTIIGGKGDKSEINVRVSHIQKEIENATSDYDKEKLQERLARLAGGVAVIKVGDISETALKEKKYRIEDALNATRAAIEEGIVPGGGTALCQIAEKFSKNKISGDEDFVRGYKIVLKAIEKPVWQIATNAGLSGDVVVNKVKTSKTGIGFDALNGDFKDMVENGIIDPVKVTRLALQNAASVASLILTSSCSITTKVDKNSCKCGNHQMANMSPVGSY